MAKEQLIWNRIGWPSTGGLSIGCKFPHINIRGQEDIVEMSDEIDQHLVGSHDPIVNRFMDLINGEGWSEKRWSEEDEDDA